MAHHATSQQSKLPRPECATHRKASERQPHSRDIDHVFTMEGAQDSTDICPTHAQTAAQGTEIKSVSVPLCKTHRRDDVGRNHFTAEISVHGALQSPSQCKPNASDGLWEGWVAKTARTREQPIRNLTSTTQFASQMNQTRLQ
jgi:hypothetical protein